MIFLSLKDYMLPCLSKQLLGIDCPGCGMQRSLAFIINGDLMAAFKMYPAVFTLILLFVFILVNLKFNFNNSKKIISRLAILNITIIMISFLIKITL
jgi:hypothetical protein